MHKFFDLFGSINLLNARAKKVPIKTYKTLYVEAVIAGNDIIENDSAKYVLNI